MAALPWITYLQRMVGRGHPTLADTLNTPLRELLTQSGYNPDASPFPGLMGPVANIRAFGAVGVGEASVSADTAALQAAFAASRYVYVPEGEFVISNAINYPDKATIFGGGAGSIIRNSVARNPNSATMLQPLANGYTNITIRDLILDQLSQTLGESPSSQCLSLQAITGCVVDNVTFRNIITMAVWCDTPIVQGVTKAVRIRGCRVENSLGGGFSVFGNVSQWVVEGCVVENCRDDAIAFQERNDGAAPSDINVNGNVILNCDRRNAAGSTPRGILFQGVSRASAVGNIINKTVAGAIVAIPNTVGCSKIKIANNVVYQAGITVDSTSGVPGNGIQIQDGVDCSINDNEVHRSRESGVRVFGSPDRIKVNDNTCVANGFSGLELQNVRDFTVAGNVLTDNGAVASPQPFGIFLSSTTRDLKTGTISNNRIGQSALGVAGFTQTEGIRIGTASGFVATDVTIDHNNMIGNTSAAIGGVAGVNIVKSRNRYSTGAMQGRAVLVNGTVTVSTAEVLAGDNISLTRVVGTSTTRGILTVGTIVAGTSFVIRAEDLAGALSADDDSTVFWEIVH